MHYKYLLNGTRAPEGWDFIRVERTADVQYTVSGYRAPAGSDQLEPTVFTTHEEALTAGKQWAADSGATIVYVEINSEDVT